MARINFSLHFLAKSSWEADTIALSALKQAEIETTGPVLISEDTRDYFRKQGVSMYEVQMVVEDNSEFVERKFF